MGAGPGGSKSGSPLRGQQHPAGIVPVGDSHSRREEKRRDGGTVELLRGIPRLFPRRSEERRARIEPPESQPWHESPGVWACARRESSSLARVRLAGVCVCVCVWSIPAKVREALLCRGRSQFFASASSSSLIP